MNLEKFLEIEEKFKLLESNIGGFYFWIYARAEIQWYIRDKIFLYNTDHPLKAQGTFKQMMLRLGMIKNAILYGRVPNQTHDVLVINSSRRVWNEDHYECIYTDEIANELGERAIVLEKPFEQRHFRPIKTANIIYTDSVEIMAQVVYYFKTFCKRKNCENIRKKISDLIIDPIKELSTAYGAEIDINDILDIIMPHLLKYTYKKKRYEAIVRKISPKIILEVAYYDADSMVINEVAKSKDILIVELQHGVTGSNHIAYNYQKDAQINQFPDYVFVFSDFWKRGISYPILSEKILPVGFPYLEKQKKKYNSSIDKKRKTILFLSQGIIGEKLSEIAVEVANSLDEESYEIVFKLHPAEYSAWKQIYPKLLKSNKIEVIDNGKTSLYELFSKADIQIGFTSTSIYEGLIYELDTYVYVQNNNPEMKDLLELGYAQKFTSANELIDLIKRGYRCRTSNVTELWKLDSLTTMKKYLDMLICRKEEA